jgi:hypothetical protein
MPAASHTRSSTVRRWRQRTESGSVVVAAAMGAATVAAAAMAAAMPPAVGAAMSATMETATAMGMTTAMEAAAAAMAAAAVPTVPANAAAPAEAAPHAIAAPIPARAMPAEIVPAIIPSAPGELNVLKKRCAAGTIDTVLKRASLKRASLGHRCAHDRDCGGGTKQKIAHVITQAGLLGRQRSILEVVPCRRRIPALRRARLGSLPRIQIRPEWRSIPGVI